MYVNFCYAETSAAVPYLDICKFAVSTNEQIDIKNLNYGLGYEVVITDGKIDFIEMFTYGEEGWDCNIEDFLGWRK